MEIINGWTSKGSIGSLTLRKGKINEIRKNCTYFKNVERKTRKGKNRIWKKEGRSWVNVKVSVYDGPKGCSRRASSKRIRFTKIKWKKIVRRNE